MDQLHSLAARYFGVEGAVTPLVSERDQNARIGTGEDSIVLKISNAAEDPSQRALQYAVLIHLAEAAPDLPLPRLPLLLPPPHPLLQLSSSYSHNGKHFFGFLPFPLIWILYLSPESVTCSVLRMSFQ